MQTLQTEHIKTGIENTQPMLQEKVSYLTIISN
jgi:hypothetical protein